MYILFVLETFIQNLVLAQRKSGVNFVKDILKGFIFFFSIWVFFHEHPPIAGLQGKGEGIF